MKNREYYVYLLKYPTSMGGSVFYVGKGTMGDNGQDRIDDHEREASDYSLPPSNPRRTKVIRNIWANNEMVVKEKIAFFTNETEAYMYEWALIYMSTYSENLTNRMSLRKGWYHKSHFGSEDYDEPRVVGMDEASTYQDED